MVGSARANPPAWRDYSFVALASLWNLLAGYNGLASVGQQAFVGLGGYLLFALAIFVGMPPLGAILLAGAVGAIVALPVGPLLFRLEGAYFAIGTWVLAEVFRLGFAQLGALGGGSGISLPVGIVTGIAAGRDAREMLIYWTGLALAVGALAFVILLLRSRMGLALTALRDSVVASESLGIDVWRTRLIVYVGVAGLTSMVWRVHLPAKAAHHARRRLQRQRLDGLCHLHRGHRRHRHH